MEILKRDGNGLHLIPARTMLCADRKIFLDDAICSETATEVIQSLYCLQKQDPEEPIRIYINSPGGEVYAGLAIYDTIKAMSAPVDLICTGLAASMAAIILGGGAKGHRFILPHSGVMIHEPLTMSGGGSATSVQRQAEAILHLKDISVELLSADCGRPQEEVAQAMAYDHFMGAQEAVEFGIVDEILTNSF